MRAYSTFVQRICIFLVMSALIGCTAVRLGYSNGETVTYWWLNSYVGFEQEQQPWVKRSIAEFFGWHRKTQLKEYAGLLTHGQERLHQTVTKADMLADYDSLKRQMMISVDEALPRFADLALQLQPHQIANIEKKFAANNEAYRKDYLRGDLEKRQAFRFKKVMTHAEYWFGNFNPEQEAQIRAASDARPLNNELWQKLRLHRQQELIKLLKKIQAEKPSREEASKMLSTYIETNFDQRFGNAEERAFFAASREGTASLAALIMNITTSEQKRHALRKMQEWIDDMLGLAERVQRAPS